MKKTILILIMLVQLNCFGHCAEFCPTPNEFRAKMQYFQTNALRLMTTNSTENIDKYVKEQENYLDSIFPGCIQYFQASTSPACSKLQTLSTSYIMLDKSKQPAAKQSINNLPSSLKTKCPTEYQTMQLFISD